MGRLAVLEPLEDRLCLSGVSFGPNINWPNGVGGVTPDSVAVGDFNDDGHPDLAVANFAANNVSVLIGNGSGGFGAPETSPVGNLPSSVAVGDFNDDGHAGLAVANQNDSTVSVLIGDGTGNFGTVPSVAVGAGPASVAVGDFNGDGHADLAVANQDDNTVSVLIGDGSGGFAAPVNFAVGNGPTSVAVGDFNGDGFADLAVANSEPFGISNTVSVVLNTTPEPSVFQLGAASYSVGEAAGPATITVTRTAGTAGGVSVQFATSDGTAIAGTDYTTTTQTLTFGPGQTSQTVTIPIINNGIVESLYQTVNLTLSNPIGGTLGSPATGVLTIKDAEPRITAAGKTLKADKNHRFTGAVASFTSADFTHATDFTAIINWGDGTQSAGSIVFNQTTGKWDVVGTHKYSKKGTFAVQITITDANGYTAVANSTMNA
jgi:hypothetical protein